MKPSVRPSSPPPKGGAAGLVFGLLVLAWLAGSLSFWAFSVRSPGIGGLGLLAVLLSLGVAWRVTKRFQETILPPPKPTAVAPPPPKEPPAAQVAPTLRPSTDLLAALSQEFRTPLNGILGMSGFLLEEELPPDARHFSRSIEQSAETLLTIVNDILDFSNLTAGRLELDPIIFNPRHTVEDVLASIEPAAASKHLELTALFEAQVPQWVEGDPGGLRQVLLYLLGNALAFTERGGVVVRLDRSPDGRLLFEVRDSGIGMSEATVSRLFQAHSQGDHASARRPAGSGLGLAISKGLVELMGGTIGVESREGHGSRFWFTLQMKHCPGPGPGPHVPVLPLGAAQGSATPRVLLAGPATGMLRTLEIHLKELGLDVRRCGGAETLDSGSVRGFDLVLLAPEGPDLGALLTRARNLREAHAPPLVLFSTFVQRGQARLARQAGFAGFLCRPLQLSYVEAVVTGVLQGHAFLITRHQFDERQISDSRPVLVTESREEALLQTCRLLQGAGWKPTWTRDGQGALEAVQQRVYDFVLMDCSSPESGGIEATRLLRAGGIKVPIIGLVAHNADAEKPEILASGLNATLTKPLRAADLTAIMEQFRPRY